MRCQCNRLAGLIWAVEWSWESLAGENATIKEVGLLAWLRLLYVSVSSLQRAAKCLPGRIWPRRALEGGFGNCSFLGSLGAFRNNQVFERQVMSMAKHSGQFEV